MALGGNRDSMREPETDLACQLNYVKILWLGDAGEAVSVSFFIKIFEVMRMAGIIDKREPGLQHILLPMMVKST